MSHTPALLGRGITAVALPDQAANTMDTTELLILTMHRHTLTRTCRRPSQILLLYSMPNAHLNIHLESFWKPTAVTLPPCPSYACSGWLLGLFTCKLYAFSSVQRAFKNSSEPGTSDRLTLYLHILLLLRRASPDWTVP